MRTYSISFNGNDSEFWTHDAILSGELTFRISEIADLASLKTGESVRLYDGTRAMLIEA